MKLDLRLKDEMVKIDEYDHIDEDIIKARIAIEDWQKTFDANKRNKDFLDEYGKQVDWDKVEGKELEERRTLYQQVKEFHKSG